MYDEDWEYIHRELVGTAAVVGSVPYSFDVSIRICQQVDPGAWYAETRSNYRKLEAALKRVERFVASKQFCDDHREVEYDAYEVRPKGKYAGKVWGA